eukprot:scaffold145379_cov33-Tisochrysis_lutea.AAC.3
MARPERSIAAAVVVPHRTSPSTYSSGGERRRAVAIRHATPRGRLTVRKVPSARKRGARPKTRREVCRKNSQPTHARATPTPSARPATSRAQRTGVSRAIPR